MHVDRMRKKYPQVLSNEEHPPLVEDQKEEGKDDVAYHSPVRNDRPVRNRIQYKNIIYVDNLDK